MREKVEAILKNIRPALQRDGGDVELVDVNQGVVKVRLKGACGGCPMASMTLKNGIEKVLKESMEVKGSIGLNLRNNRQSDRPLPFVRRDRGLPDTTRL
jgi:Fe-S cluster biogenesis protein NfuA